MTNSGAPPTAVEGIDVPRVSAWLAGNIPGCRPPLRFRLIAGGRSNLTYEVVDDNSRRCVLRRPPTGQVLPTAHDMAREYRVIAALGPAGVPVAPAMGLCTDSAVNGAPFYVMGFVDGHVLRDPAQVEATLSMEARRRSSEDLIDVLASIHAVDPDRVGLGDLGRREGYVTRQLRRWDGQYRACRDDYGGPALPDLEAAHAALAGRVPEQGPATVVHGDYRLDNTVVDGSGSVQAVLDWELSTLGDPLADVGQLLTYWTEPGDETTALESSPTTAPGFFTRAEMAARYAERSGRDLSRIDFYLALSYWKLGCILEGVYTRYVGGAMGDDGANVAHIRRSLDWLAVQARSMAETLSA